MGPFHRSLGVIVGCATMWIAPPLARATDADHASIPVPSCEGDSAQGWHGVAVSRDDARSVAVWSDGDVWVSRDEGRTWTRPISLASGYVESVVVLSDRRYAVLTGNLAEDPPRLFVASSDGRTIERVMPFEPRALVGSGGTLALVTTDRIATSTDAGRTWRVARGGFGAEPEYVTLGAWMELDGTVRVVATDLNTCTSVDRLEWMHMSVLHRDAPRIERRGQHDFARGAVAFHPGAHGWVYAWGGTGLVAMTPHASLGMRGYAPELEDAADGWSRRLVVGSNGRITIGVVGGDVVRLDGRRAVPLVSGAPRDAVDLDVDARGRPWILDARGNLSRYSRVDGWTPVLPGCGAPSTP